MLTLNTASTALVIIDLQEGILPFAGGPYSADEVVARSARLAEHFRAKGAPVVMVRVGWSKDFAEALRQPVDAPTPAQALPPEWWHYPVALGKRDSDIEVIKRQWGAFYGTDLELQCVGAALIPWCCAGSPPISVWNLRRATLGSWGSRWYWRKTRAVQPAQASTKTVSRIYSPASPACVRWRRLSPLYDLYRFAAMVAPQVGAAWDQYACGLRPTL